MLCSEVRTLIKGMKKGQAVQDESESDHSEGISLGNTTPLSGGSRASTPQSATSGHNSCRTPATTPGCNSTESTTMLSAEQLAKEQMVFYTQLINLDALTRHATLSHRQYFVIIIISFHMRMWLLIGLNY